jgi:hypothetical protein
MLTLVSINLFYTVATVRASEKKFCDIINTAIVAYRDNPPDSDLGRQMRRNYDDLRNRLRC